MDWTSWSQTWSTKRTTTTSRKPLRWSLKNLRLQADPRLKQNQEDVPLIAHLQGLFLFLKEHGLILNQELKSIKLSQCQNDQTLFFGTDNYLEKKTERSNSGDWKMIIGTNLSTLNVGLMMYGRARWQEAETTRKDFNIVLTHQNKKFFISELFNDIQDAIPLILHCKTNSERFLRVHLSYWMCSQFALHHKIRIDSGRTKFEQRKTDSILYSRESHEKRITWMWKSLIWPNHVLHRTSQNGNGTRIRCIGSIYRFLNGKDWSSIKQDRTQSSSTLHFQLIVSRQLLWWNLEKSYTRRYICHLDHHRKFPTKIIGCVIWILMSLEAAKIPNESNPNPKTQLSRAERPECGQESTKQTKKRTEFDHNTLSQEKHDEVTDSTSTGDPHWWIKKRSTNWFQCTRTVTLSCKGSRTSPSSEELVKKMESHPHRDALHADLQQNNVYNPFSNNSKAMIREMGNVELFELCETVPKVQCSHCLLYWNQNIVYGTFGQFLLDSESRRKLNKLRLDALSIPNYVIKKGPNHGARHGKTEEQKEYHMGLECVEEMLQENWRPRGTLQKYSRSFAQRDIKDSGISHWTSRARMRRCDFDQTFELQSQPKTVSSIENQAKNVQNPFLQQYRRWHPSSSRYSWWDWDVQ